VLKKLVLTFLVCIVVYTSSAISEIVQIDIAGTMIKYRCEGTFLPSNKYLLGDKYTARFCYDTKLFEEKSQTYDQFWSRSLLSRTSIESFFVEFYRGDEIFETIDVFEQYPNQLLLLETYSDNYVPITFLIFLAKMYDTNLEQIDYPVVLSWVEFAAIAREEIFTENIFSPNEIFDVTQFSELRFNIISQYCTSLDSIDGLEAYVFDVSFVDVTIVPEPASLSSLVIGAVLLRRSK